MISFLVSLIVVIVHSSPIGKILFVGSKSEGTICFVMVMLWSALVAVICDVSNGLAVDERGSVTFGNLYYFGWAGFACAILLFINFMKTVHSFDAREELTRRGDRLNLWVATLTCGLVLMSSAANLYDFYCETDKTGKIFCNRSLLAILMGSSAAIGSIVVIGIKSATGTSPFGLEFSIAILLFLANCFSLGLVTNEDGPGAKIGNLFYFSWFSLIFSFLLVASCYEHYSASMETAAKELELFDKFNSREYTEGEGFSKALYDGEYSRNPKGTYDDDSSVASGYPSKRQGGYFDDQSVASGYPSKEKRSYYDDPSLAKGYLQKSKVGSYYEDDPSVASGYPQKPKRGGYYGDDQKVVREYPQKPKSYYDDDPSVASGYPQKPKSGGYYDDDSSVLSEYPQKPKGGGHYDDDLSVASGYPQKAKSGGYYDDDPSVASGYPQKPKSSGYYDDDPSVASDYPQKPKSGDYYDDDL